MLRNIAIGAGMMVLTTAIHSVFMVINIKALRLHAPYAARSASIHRLRATGGTVLLMFTAALIEASVWAIAYVKLGAISGAEEALYFSTVTFTTLGYGEIVLGPEWRLLASFQAANGIIMFGWTTAVVIAVVQRVYRRATKE